jgi:hypothetical protein
MTTAFSDDLTCIPITTYGISRLGRGDVLRNTQGVQKGDIVVKTLVVPNRHAWRSHRVNVALDASPGVRLLTIDQLAARLAGGFLQPVNQDDLATAVAESLEKSLGELNAIKALPGFQRAAAGTLSRAWSAGLNLAEEEAAAAGDAEKERLESLRVLEHEVLNRLPKGQLRPLDLVAQAMARISHARSLFGEVEIHGRTEMSPVWRPLLTALAKETEVRWVAGTRIVPDWLQATGVSVERRPAQQPTVTAYSCASPRHEILEALRWARRLLSQGIEAQQIAIATASPTNWDDHVLALSQAANLPIHFVHGRAALDTTEGQLVAALAEILLRGFSQPRVKRLVGLLRSQNNLFRELPSDWWRALPADAPLLDAPRWKREIGNLMADKFSDGIDHRQLIERLIDTIGQGLNQAATIGEQLLEGRALAIWRKALTDGPAAALDVTIGRLRVDDAFEPATTVIWAPASAIAAVPRPFTWLVGLTSKSWPRRASEDPLLPDHIIPASRLDPLPVHQADRRDFQTLWGATERALVCSRARRDSGGRLNGISSLFPREVPEVYLAQSREPEHAASLADRLFARPAEFAALPEAKSALSTWIDWHTADITAHDGKVRANHPLLLRALDRRQSASSLVKLLRDPLGYLWHYGFGWNVPEETDEPLTLDALAFGNLLHETLQGAIEHLEETAGGFAAASDIDLKRAIKVAVDSVAARWDETSPVPPPVIWQRKCADAEELAFMALSAAEVLMPGQRSFAEVPFGGNPGTLDGNAVPRLPWNPLTPVIIPGTSIKIGGSIDRLDLSSDGTEARVTDYKSGKEPSKPPQLKGGAELQRCLYAFAVRSLIAAGPTVEARLLYPRGDKGFLPLVEPEATLTKLTAFLAAAYATFTAGYALPGPAAADAYNDLAFALPGGAKESYIELMLPLVTKALEDVAPLWEEL